MEIYQIQHLSFAYPNQAEKALTDVDLAIQTYEFLTLCGPSGSGKTTLLRQLKPAMAPWGERTGEILFQGTPLSALEERRAAQEIGFVQQSPDNQLVTDKVWHELAFGMESLGKDPEEIRLRTAEMASFFGIEDWFYQPVGRLSGGQKQLLNLASVLAMQPKVLILDEPTSQLDPIAASDFLGALARVNRELGVTVILTEHRLEEALPLSDRCVVLDQGRILADGSPRAVAEDLKRQGHRMFLAMPTPMRVWAAVENDLACPLTVREGRQWMSQMEARHPAAPLPNAANARREAPPVLTAENLWFRYEQDGPDILKGLTLTLRQGELFALLGGNGAGKTTALSVLGGIYKPLRGRVCLAAGVKTAVLPQDPQSLFVRITVEADLLEEVLSGEKLPAAEKSRRVQAVAETCEILDVLDRHPYDLSGGQQQRAALAKVLLTEPDILLLDEPTKGMDAAFKQQFAALLRRLQQAGKSILLVSHDVEFCAAYGAWCALFFDGTTVAQGPPQVFFSGNSFYTTAANRMARHVLPQAVTAADIISAYGGSVPQAPETAVPAIQAGPVESRQTQRGRRPVWRSILALAFFAASLALGIYIAGFTEITLGDLTGGVGADLGVWRYCAGVALMLLGAAIALALLRREKRQTVSLTKGKLAKRTWVAVGLILLLIPLTIYLGASVWGGRKYYFISLLILVETFVPFVLVFEGREPKAREMVVVAVLCALGVAGRAAFFWLPQFKPVAAIVILAGVAFGGETGFLVGAVTMFVSNMLFGQGPWTPYQMFAMGAIGFLAGILSRKGLLGAGRLQLTLYGFVSVLLLYGLTVDTASALIWKAAPSWQVLASYYVTGLPFNLVHAAATGFFLWAAGPAVLEKLERIKEKYGMIQ